MRVVRGQCVDSFRDSELYQRRGEGPRSVVVGLKDDLEKTRDLMNPQ